MILDYLPILLAIITVLAGIGVFLQKKSFHSVIFLALASTGSALIFLYVGQTLIALLQLLVFVGGLSTYLIVAIATEEKQAKMSSNIVFLVASMVIAAGLSLLVYTLQPVQIGNNDFSTIAQNAFSQYYALFFAAVFLMFAVGIGSVLVMKKFTRLVV